MKFRTEVEIEPSPLRINHRQQILLLGSCFAENIGLNLLRNKFDVLINPFGMVYNPLSAATVAQMLLDKYLFTEDDILHDKGLYFTLMHHNDFSDDDRSSYLKKIRQIVEEGSRHLQKTDVVMITFGTAFAYRWKETGKIVSNCHKLPASQFIRERLSVSQIVEAWSAVVSQMLTGEKPVKFLFTVSPIRHWKDGAHENQLSKSILLLAVEELQKMFPDSVFYFPSYELALDDLRDYRYYAEDMIHLNNMAIKYVWEKFSETFFDAETQLLIDRWASLSKAVSHRPFRADTAEHRLFVEKTVQKLEQFALNYPFLNCKDEISQLKNKVTE